MLFIVSGAVLLLVLLVAWLYNSLVRLRVLADNAWADIDVQLKRRHDLVPNLVDTVKGAADYERGTLDAVVAARSRAMSAEGPSARGQAEAGLAAALRQLFALAEAYPHLRAVGNFSALQGSLASIEDAIQSARRYYNAVVRDYNTRIQQVPANLFAAGLGFSPREFFQLDDPGERAVPKTNLGAQP
jgi:LemA protein